MTPAVTVIGSGPAGLAVAACLGRRGITPLVVDRGRGVGQSWRDRYERLHLHTPRVQSHLPGLRIPRRMGRWVSRDGVVAYLEDYAVHHGITPRFGVTVRRIDRDGGRWRVETTDDSWTTDVVVVSTGYSNVPHLPDWFGRDGFAGTLIHAADYRTAAPYVDGDVLVVGTGNTGAEIAADLAEHGTRSVRLAVRTPPHIVPRTIAGVPTTLLGIANEFTPPAVGDPVNRLLQRLTIGDLGRFGMPAPRLGLIAQYRATDVIPIIDVGLVEHLRAGRVEPVAGVEGFDGHEVVLIDGSRVRVDTVIAATGYRTGLETMVDHLGVLDDLGRPTVGRGRTHPKAPNLYFVGLRNPQIGLLNAIRIDARRTARSIVG